MDLSNISNLHLDSNDNLTSKGQGLCDLCAAEKVGYAIAVPLICFIGMLLNLINLVVLWQKSFKESSYTYLTSLALADLMSLFFFGVNGIGRGHYPHDRGWRFFEVFVYFPCGASTTTASVLLTVTVTVERFIFIYKPAQSKTWCQQNIARRISAAVWATGIIINIPRFFVLNVGMDGKLGYTKFGESFFYRYLSWSYFFIVSLGSGLVLMIFNTLLIVGIKRAAKRRLALISGSRKANQSRLQSVKESVEGASLREKQRERDDATLTRTLIAVVCVFILGEMPSAFTSRGMVTALLGSSDVLSTAWYRIAVLISTILVVLQHSTNFVIYCLFNRRFAEVFSRYFIKSCCRRRAVHEEIAKSTTGMTTYKLSDE